MKSPLTLEIKESGFDYNLAVDGEVLDITAVSPQYFHTILTISRNAILATIESEYQEDAAKERGKGIVGPPPITVLNLGTNADENSIFTTAGMTNPHYIRTLKQDIRKNVHPYLNVVEDNGFIPEVRLIKDDRAALLGRGAISLRMRAHNEQTSFSPEYDPYYFIDTYPCFRQSTSRTIVAGQTDVLFVDGNGGLKEHTIPSAAIDTTISVDTLLGYLPDFTLPIYSLREHQLLGTHCKFVDFDETAGQLVVEVPAMPNEDGIARMQLPPLYVK